MNVGNTSKIVGMAFFLIWTSISALAGAETWQAGITGSIAGFFGVLLGLREEEKDENKNR